MVRNLTITLSIFLFATIQLVLADSSCEKNAWVAFEINSDNGTHTCGDMILEAGKGAVTLTTITAMRSLGVCAFHNSVCTGARIGDRWNFCCNKANDRTVGMHGQDIGYMI
ncbi:hypothetical protein BCR42DRAFT_469345 [Absidia repens]|uniref:Uncharacterized protein n=1 Tax=Absidia repens TaxID=90262 RepID=A0A1X2I8I4_9FUNG|nr:hypothetical protein BCR42DRAFT_469345 [Absidia repens]